MNYKHLIVALMVLAAGSPLAAQSVKAGIEAWQKADYPGAVAIWRPLAEKGDADAQFNLGQAYRLGRGVPTNLSAAQTWFERAANQGHLDAQATLGLLLFQSGDQAGGLRWLKGAALKGEPRALLVYGTALFNGDGVTQDPVMGYAFVSRAAAQGLAPAKETLAQMDKILPLADRKKGVAIAIANARKAPAPKSHTITVKPPREPEAGAAGRGFGNSQAETRARGRCRGAGEGRRMANPARRFFAKVLGRSAVPQAFGQRRAGRAPGLLHPGRRDHPAPGRAVRVPRRRERRLQRAQGPGLLRRSGEIVSRGTSRAA